MGHIADENELQKGMIVFGLGKGNTLAKLEEFVGVFKRMAMRMGKQWQRTKTTGNFFEIMTEINAD